MSYIKVEKEKKVNLAWDRDLTQNVDIFQKAWIVLTSIMHDPDFISIALNSFR